MTADEQWAERALRALEFHEHLLRGDHQQLARDFIDMGMMEPRPSGKGPSRR